MVCKYSTLHWDIIFQIRRSSISAFQQLLYGLIGNLSRWSLLSADIIELGWLTPLGPIVLLIHSESCDDYGERYAAWPGACGQIGEVIYQFILWLIGGRCGHCDCRYNTVPVQYLNPSHIFNLLIFHNVLGGLGKGSGHIFHPHIQYQSHQRYAKLDRTPGVFPYPWGCFSLKISFHIESRAK